MRASGLDQGTRFELKKEFTNRILVSPPLRRSVVIAQDVLGRK